MTNLKYKSMRALIVDDEPMNRDTLEEDLLDEGFEVVSAEDGQVAWDILQKDDNFNVILLDRMMPNMSGMDLIKKIKADKKSKLANIPVIMQTAAAEKSQVVEGIKSGVYYYLTKPFETQVMLSVVAAAVYDYAAYNSLREEVDKYRPKLHLVKESFFEVVTLDDVRCLSTFLSNYYPDPDRVVFGISEILINAVEHGNLGINYKMKSELLLANKWEREIAKMVSLPENRGKKVLVHYKNHGTHISLNIKDHGKGFNWQRYMEIDPERATDCHGRGIALSKLMSFDEINYLGKGNEVECIIHNPVG